MYHLVGIRKDNSFTDNDANEDRFVTFFFAFMLKRFRQIDGFEQPIGSPTLPRFGYGIDEHIHSVCRLA